MAEQSHAVSPSDPILSLKLSRLIHGLVHTQLIFVAAKLGIADLLADGAKSTTELANATSVIESRLYRVMRALASIGIFAEDKPRQFKLTPLAIPLQSNIPESQRDFAIMMGSQWHVSAWANIMHCLKSEASAFEDVFKCGLFEYLEEHPNDGAVFNNAMTFTSRKHTEAICGAYDFANATTLVDVGGGHGFLLSALLKRHPTLSGILFDLPSVAETATEHLRSEGLDQRCQVVGGDFFEALPKGGDLYMLKYIVHDWDDADAVQILQNCRDAMNPGASLLLIEAVVPARNASFGKTWSDIEMMVMLSNGKERTETEFQDLFSRAGLALRQIIPTRSELSILEAAAD